MIFVPHLPGKHIWLMMYVPLPRKHILLGICVPLCRKHTPLLMLTSIWRWDLNERISRRPHCITALFTNLRILKFQSQLTIAFFAAVNHLSGPLRKHNFTSTGSTGHSLCFVIGGFRSVLCASCFKVRYTAAKNAIVKAAFKLESLHVCEKRSKWYFREIKGISVLLSWLVISLFNACYLIYTPPTPPPPPPPPQVK